MKKILLSTLTAAAIAAAAAVPASAACVPEQAQRRPACYEWSWSCGFSLPENDCAWIVWPENGGLDWNDWLKDICGDWSCLPENGCGGSADCPGTDGTPVPDGTPDAGETPTPGEKPDAGQTPDTGPAPDSGGQPDRDESQSGSASSLERQVAVLVNEERAAHGLPPLALNTELCDGARMKSRDMAQTGYFSHNSPTYGTPFEMMRSLGITYRSAGENIAKGYATAEAVMNAWMSSEGHRANILSADYTQLGVGYVADGSYWTQWFTG